MNETMNCKAAANAMPDLLFDPGAAPREAHAHLRSCVACHTEFKSLQQTMNVLEGWEAPEPAPYWTARMGARLREEQAREPRGWAGFRERLRTRFWLSNHSLQPVAGVAALGLVLAVGGGAWLDLSSGPAAAPPTQASNIVQDLQSLNENAQVFQQLSSLDSPDTSAETSN